MPSKAQLGAEGYDTSNPCSSIFQGPYDKAIVEVIARDALEQGLEWPHALFIYDKMHALAYALGEKYPDTNTGVLVSGVSLVCMCAGFGRP
jgi:hypothetical protein